MWSSLPDAATLAWWGTAWLTGRVGPDDLLDALRTDPDAPAARLRGVHGEDPETAVPLLVGLARLRSLGASAVAATFPTPADPIGLGGPVAFNAEAVEAEEAVLLPGTGLGMIPEPDGLGVIWQVGAAVRRPVDDLGEADRALRAGLHRAALRLADLDVARWRPELADTLMNLRHGEPLDAPPGTPPQAVELAGRALRLLTVADLALSDEGGSASVHEIGQRREALLTLERPARAALSAACSPDAWPPGR